MSQITVRLVGGPADGVLVRVSEFARYVVTLAPTPPAEASFHDKAPPVPLSYTQYRYRIGRDADGVDARFEGVLE